MADPIDVDGIRLTDDLDFTIFARDALRGGAGLPGRPSDMSPLEAIDRLYSKLRGTAFADRLSEGIAENISSSDPEVRKWAVIFMENHPMAKGHEKLLERAAQAQAQPRRSGDQGKGAPSEEWSVMRSVGAQVSAGDEHARQIARAEALRPGKAQPVIASLTANDTQWVLDHLADIVIGSPDAVAPIFFQLFMKGHDYRKAAERLAYTVGVDVERVKNEIATKIPHPGLRSILLAALSR